MNNLIITDLDVNQPTGILYHFGRYRFANIIDIRVFIKLITFVVPDGCCVCDFIIIKSLVANKIGITSNIPIEKVTSGLINATILNDVTSLMPGSKMYLQIIPPIYLQADSIDVLLSYEVAHC